MGAMDKEITMTDAACWAVAGILTDLEGAVLTSSVGDGGLAGTFEMVGPLAQAANEGRYGPFTHIEGEMG
jgi:hypothetical protein